LNVFQLRQRLIDDYASYIRSFLNIADDRLQTHIETELEQGLLSPHPLIQLNPAFEPGANIDGLVTALRTRLAILKVAVAGSAGPHRATSTAQGGGGTGRSDTLRGAARHRVGRATPRSRYGRRS